MLTPEAWAAELAHAAATIDDECDAIAGRHARDAAEHQRATAPVDTGRLRASITVDRDSDGWSVGPTVDYGRYVEYGTSDTDPHPFVGPSGDAVADGFAADVLDTAVP